MLWCFGILEFWMWPTVGNQTVGELERATMTSTAINEATEEEKKSPVETNRTNATTTRARGYAFSASGKRKLSSPSSTAAIAQSPSDLEWKKKNSLPPNGKRLSQLLHENAAKKRKTTTSPSSVEPKSAATTISTPPQKSKPKANQDPLVVVSAKTPGKSSSTTVTQRKTLSDISNMQQQKGFSTAA